MRLQIKNSYYLFVASKFDENHLGPVPVYEGVTIIAAEQLGHRDHRHVLLQTKVGVDQPSQFTSLKQICKLMDESL